MTEQRLWVLYCIADLSYREISELTGWNWNALKAGIRKWNLAWTHNRHIDTDAAICTGLAEAFHVYAHTKPLATLTETEITRSLVEVSVLVNESRAAFRKRLQAGDVGWELIDALDIEKSVVILARCLRGIWAREVTR